MNTLLKIITVAVTVAGCSPKPPAPPVVKTNADPIILRNGLAASSWLGRVIRGGWRLQRRHHRLFAHLRDNYRGR
jgi:hypothetical protein